MGKKKKSLSVNKKNYQKFLREILERIRSTQYEAFKIVNREMMALYWDIGKNIVEKQQKEGWGKAVVEQLSQDLQKVFPGIRGFSTRNLWRMRDFYLAYHENPRLAPLVGAIGWSHNVVVMSKCKDDLEREFYLRMTAKYGWTKNVLIHQIENQTYEKTLLGQTNFEVTVSPEIRNQAKLAVKDEYTYDFLELGEEHSERELEREIVANIEYFLREMGGMFTFAGSQYRLEVSGQEYFIDLLLYHRGLRCLIALELKIGKFIPEYVGKMQFYLSVLDDTVRIEGEKPSIGIILCKSKDRTIVEYTLREANRPIGVASYRIMSRPPRELEGQLPTPEQVGKLLEGIEARRQSSSSVLGHSLVPQKLPIRVGAQKVKFTPREKKVIRYVEKNGKITNGSYQKIRKVKKSQASKELSQLVERGILRKMGKRGRGTYYVLNFDG